MYVIRRNEDGAYVAPSGQRSSYTRSLEHARKFDSLEAAIRECCGNETVISVSSILDGSYSQPVRVRQ